MENKFAGFCTACGAGFEENQSFCEKCGQKIERRTAATIETTTPAGNGSTVVETTIRYEVNTKKIRNIIIAIVAVIACLGIGTVAINAINTARAEEAKEEYLDNAEEFMTLVLDAGVNLEDISDTVVDYWYDCIWNDMYGDDINQAVATALSDKSDEIEEAEEYDKKVNDLYKKLKKVPDNLSDDDREELKEICTVIKKMYNVYTQYYSMATDPTGSYESYVDENLERTDEFLEVYNELESLLE